MDNELKELGFYQNNGTYWYTIDEDSDVKIEIGDVYVYIWKYEEIILSFGYSLDKVKKLINIINED